MELEILSVLPFEDLMPKGKERLWQKKKLL